MSGTCEGTCSSFDVDLLVPITFIGTLPSAAAPSTVAARSTAQHASAEPDWGLLLSPSPSAGASPAAFEPRSAAKAPELRHASSHIGMGAQALKRSGSTARKRRAKVKQP
jgi:hypothetical protein